jgi:hypothetical protein
MLTTADARLFAALHPPLRQLASVPDFAALRATEFARLDAEGHAYLDYTGSALYPESLV